MSNAKKTNTLILLLGVILLFSVNCKNDSTHINSDTAIEEEKNNSLFGNFPMLDVANTWEEDLSGELIVLTEDDFILKITDIDNIKGFQYKSKTPCVVDFYADWCKPCMRLNPLLIELAKEYQGEVIFYKVNIERAPNVTRMFDINNIPTLLFFKRYAAPTKIEGAPLKEDLKNAIDEILLSENR